MTPSVDCGIAMALPVSKRIDRRRVPELLRPRPSPLAAPPRSRDRSGPPRASRRRPCPGPPQELKTHEAVLVISFADRPLDGRGSAPARQVRKMQVHPSVCGHCQNVREEPGRHRRRRRRGRRPQPRCAAPISGVFQRRRLQEFNARLCSHLGHRGRVHRLAAPAPGRRAGDDQGDLVGGSEQGTQRRVLRRRGFQQK